MKFKSVALPLTLSCMGSVHPAHQSFARNAGHLAGHCSRHVPWTSPYARIILMIERAGRPEQWAIEMNGPRGVAPQGWKPKASTPGIPVEHSTVSRRSPMAASSCVAIGVCSRTCHEVILRSSCRALRSQFRQHMAVAGGSSSSLFFNHLFGQHSRLLNRQPTLSRNLACSVSGRMTVAPRQVQQINTRFSP